jgi:hypothetical protein
MGIVMTCLYGIIYLLSFDAAEDEVSQMQTILFFSAE